MKKKILYIILASQIICFATIAQPGFYVPLAGKIFFSGDSATIFSSIINKGSFGVGRKAIINFSGAVWENAPSSFITDEDFEVTGIYGKGGWVRFISDTIRQKISGGYNAALKSGPSFFQVQVKNKFGIEFTGSNTKIRKEIKLSDGLVYLRDNILVVGDNNPGSISGFDSSRYFVTGSSFGGGMLLRENISESDGPVIFPVGSREHAYTPASVKSKSLIGDDFYANVFDSVKSDLLAGTNLYAESVNKTWAIGKSFRTYLDEVEISLQHRNDDEGSLFSSNKRNSYISKFTGTGWDVAQAQALPAEGNLTTGTVIESSGVNNRIFINEISNPTYFTKFTGSGDPTVKTYLWLNANVIDEKKVHVYWLTNPENFVQYFIVQRMLSNENMFTDIDTIASKNPGGVSYVELEYSVMDMNSYQGTSFYRLKRVDYGNVFAYSDVVSVDRNPKRNDNLLWPNPAKEKFNISLGKLVPIKYITITDISGRKVKQENVNGRRLIEMGGLIPGAYFVSFAGFDGNITETKKLIIIGD